MARAYVKHDYAVTGRDYVEIEGGDTPAGVTVDLLYTGATTTSAELNAEYTDYKVIIFVCTNTNIGGNIISLVIPSEAVVLNQSMLLGHGSTINNERRVIGKFTDATHITITTAENNSSLAAVYGIK